MAAFFMKKIQQIILSFPAVQINPDELSLPFFGLDLYEIKFTGFVGTGLIFQWPPISME